MANVNLFCLIFLVMFFSTFSIRITKYNFLNTKRCLQKREEITQKIIKGLSPHLTLETINILLPGYLNLALDKSCKEKTAEFQEFDFTATSGMSLGGPLGTIGTSFGPVFTEPSNRVRRELANQQLSDLEEDEIGHDHRVKRFAGSFGMNMLGMGSNPSGSGSPAGPKKEVSESAQAMQMFRMMMMLQKQHIQREYSPPTAGQGYYGDQMNIGGMYGSQLPSRKKRSAEKIENSVSKDAKRLSRHKRFFFMSEPSDNPPVNPRQQLMSIMMGTATDPNTGKRIKFGGDSMEKMMTNQYLQTMPEHMRPPPGKEASDMVQKVLAPMWYYRQIQPMNHPNPWAMYGQHSLYSPYMNYQSSYFNTPGHRRNADGMYGDMLPRKRRKRSVESLKISEIKSESKSRNRVKRQSEGALKIGDISIPMELLKPENKYENKNEEIKGGHHRPAPTRTRTITKTRYVPVYKPVYYPQPQPSYYSRQTPQYYGQYRQPYYNNRYRQPSYNAHIQKQIQALNYKRLWDWYRYLQKLQQNSKSSASSSVQQPKPQPPAQPKPPPLEPSQWGPSQHPKSNVPPPAHEHRPPQHNQPPPQHNQPPPQYNQLPPQYNQHPSYNSPPNNYYPPPQGPNWGPPPPAHNNWHDPNDPFIMGPPIPPNHPPPTQPLPP